MNLLLPVVSSAGLLNYFVSIQTQGRPGERGERGEPGDPGHVVSDGSGWGQSGFRDVEMQKMFSRVKQAWMGGEVKPAPRVFL